MEKTKFIKRFEEKYGIGILDFSKIPEKFNWTDFIEVRCIKHNYWFSIQPQVVLSKHHNNTIECPECNRLRRQEEFIKKAKEIHKDKNYDYSKVHYINANTNVIIICPIHGEFEQKPSNHLDLKRNGCPYCTGHGRLNNEIFIERSNKIHNFKYDYSKVEYVNNSTPVIIICPEHGEFEQTPTNHLKGEGCPYCAGHARLNNEIFIERSNKIHNFKYDYSKVEYVNNSTPVIIICPEHGEFEQTPANHLYGKGCPYCAGHIVTTESFIEKAKEVHKDENYDYSKVIYKSAHEKVIIICPEHGEFLQTPNNHLRGRSCPKCAKQHSKLEKTVEKFLKDNNITYIPQKTFDWLIFKNNMKLDLYLPDFNIAIECHGEQHFSPHFYYGRNFELRQKRDCVKNIQCKEHGIDILYFSLKDYEKIYENYELGKVYSDLNELLKIIMSYKQNTSE